MRNALATVILVWLVATLVFPEQAGYRCHQIYNDFMKGWNSVGS